MGLWRHTSPNWQQTLYNKDEDFIFASPTLNGKQPLWGQTMNADFVKPAALALGLVTKGERFGWHRFRHSLSTWANEITKDITVSQTLLRHSKPDMTHGTFDKALEAQRKYMEQLLAAKTHIGGHPMTSHRVGIGLRFRRQKTTAIRKRLCGKEMLMVGAIGFEPMTSTV